MSHIVVQRGTQNLRRGPSGCPSDKELSDGDRHVKMTKSRVSVAAPNTLTPFSDWLDRNPRLLHLSRAILDDPGTHGVHLNRMELARRPL